MTTFFVITFSLILMAIGVVALVCARTCNTFNDILLSSSAIFMFVLGGISIENELSKETGKPTAMDVYQGKTEMQTTFRGGIPVDSVVVFKQSENKEDYGK